jgi:hypothetical protein
VPLLTRNQQDAFAQRRSKCFSFILGFGLSPCTTATVSNDHPEWRTSVESLNMHTRRKKIRWGQVTWLTADCALTHCKQSSDLFLLALTQITLYFSDWGVCIAELLGPHFPGGERPRYGVTTSPGTLLDAHTVTESVCRSPVPNFSAKS